MHLRVLVHPAGSAPWNMAVDEAILESSSVNEGLTLRFYSWTRPTVSLGFGQPHRRGFDEFVGRRQGIGLVRRPTGGRAVLHADELTYALVGPAGQGLLSGDITSSYRHVAGGFAAALRELGAPVGLHKSVAAEGRLVDGNGSCFAARARYELTADGRKLMGSAQRRRNGSVLQHGSLLLGRPDERLWRALGPGAKEAARDSVGLSELLGERPSRRRLIGAIAEKIAQRGGFSTRYGVLTRVETRAAMALQQRYKDPGWTRRR